MKIEELRDLYPNLVKEYAYNEIKYIEQLTGYPVDIIIVDNIKNGADALTKIARGYMTETKIFIKKEMLEFLNHTILHECGHIRRIFSVDKNERVSLSKTISFSNWKYINKIRQYLIKLGVNESNIVELINMYIDGCLSQIFNSIPDIRIENYIYDNFEENRDEQKAYLNYLSKTLEKITQEKALTFTPSPIVEVSLGLNFLFLDNIKHIIGTRILNIYKNVPLAKKGYKKIKHVLNKETKEDLGYKQDLELTNEILKSFEIDFATWIDFNSIGLGYENDY